jgi:hypothetical protein
MHQGERGDRRGESEEALPANTATHRHVRHRSTGRATRGVHNIPIRLPILHLLCTYSCIQSELVWIGNFLCVRPDEPQLERGERRSHMTPRPFPDHSLDFRWWSGLGPGPRADVADPPTDHRQASSERGVNAAVGERETGLSRPTRRQRLRRDRRRQRAWLSLASRGRMPAGRS